MNVDLTLWSTSRAQDAGYLALADISGLAAQLGADYRIVGGQMVTLLVEAFAATGAPARETADADFAAAAPVVADERLLGALTERGYEMESGNRFVRTVGQLNLSAPADHPHDHPADGGSNEDPLVLTIDVLVPSYSARHEPNQPVGELTVDAIPGLSLALARPAIAITVTAQLREPTLADTVNLPTTFPVLGRVP